MAGPITYAAIALLARDRLDQIVRTLRAKNELGTAHELELHVLHLAERAHAMMSAAQPTIAPPVRLYGPPLTDGVSRFMLLGAMGPDLMRYASLFAEGQDWLYHTLHKGTPDENRERIYVESTNTIFLFWDLVGGHIAEEFSDADDRVAPMANMRAYVLGHLCHVATDVLAHPWMERFESQLGVPAGGVPGGALIPRLNREEVGGAIDRNLANTFFDRYNVDTRGKWADWFPSPGDVPDSFYEALASTIEIAFLSKRPEGLPSFEETFAAIDPAPPDLDAHMIEDGVTTFRSVIEIGRVWDLGQWIGATAPMFLPLIAAYPMALVLEQADDLSRSLAAEGPDAAGIRSFEQAAFPFMMTALSPLVTMIIVSASGRGLRAEGVTGWINAGLQVVFAVAFFATLGSATRAHWVFLFILPLFFNLAQMIFALARGSDSNVRTLLWLGPLVGLSMALLFLLCWSTFLHEGIEEFNKDSSERDHAKAWGFFVLWLVIVVALWIVHALLWRYVFSGEHAEDPHRFDTVDPPRKYLQLYDDATLIVQPEGFAGSEKLSDHIYPTSRRPLLKLWFEGAGTLRVRIDHDRMVFTTDAANPPPPGSLQTIFVPLAALSVEDFGKLLEASVKDGGGGTGQLKFKAAHDEEKELLLSPGFTLSDHGDDKDTQADHDAAADDFLAIGTTEEAAFVLHHAPRHRLSSLMGRAGPARDVTRAESASVAGSTVTSRAAPDGRTLDATAGSLLRGLLQPGDIVETTAAPIQRRVVERVEGDTVLVVSSPFTPPLAAAGYKRAASDWSADVAAAPNTLFTPNQRTGIGPNDVEGTAQFGTMLRAGDTIRVNTVPPQIRRVVAVKDDAITAAPIAVALLELDAPLAPPVPAPVAAPFLGVAFDRVAEEQAEGFGFVADEDETFGTGESVMNDAADLAVLLCLGGVARMAPGETPAGATTPVRKVYEILRNWNLDRRRVNEWKMMVGGQAFSEKRGDHRARDEATSIELVDDYSGASDAFIGLRAEGETLANRLGWLGTFRSWVEMAGRPGNDITSDDVFRPGQPTNRELSRAMAFMVDAEEPVMP